MKQKIDIIEVGPRDGFQNIAEYIPMQTKMDIIEGLIDAGVKSMQFTSFVNPKVIPQLKDAKEISEKCLAKYPNLELYALVPNAKGAKIAVDVGMKKVSTVVSLSETHNLANIKSSHVQSIEGLLEIKNNFPELKVCIDLATAFGCPFEGIPSIQKLVDFVGRISALGFREFNICDTIGIANPKQVRHTMKKLIATFIDCQFQVHIHDTRNMGMVNTLSAIESGVTQVQTTLGGLGGCPFAPGASGNTATEDLVYMLEQMGYDTGINFDKLLTLAKYEREAIPSGCYSGHHMNISKSCSV